MKAHYALLNQKLEFKLNFLSKSQVDVSWVGSSSGDTLGHFTPSWWCFYIQEVLKWLPKWI